jgi:hypothetical protein
MTNEEILLKNLTPELLKVFSNSPNYGSIGINVILHDNKPVRIESSRTVTMKVIKNMEVNL